MKKIVGILSAVVFSIAIMGCQTSRPVTPAQVQVTSDAASAAAGPSQGV